MSETRISELDPWRTIGVDERGIWVESTHGERVGSIRLDQPETRRKVAAALLEGLEPEKPYCGEHEPVQHRDGKPAWCNACGLTAGYQVPQSSFASKKGFKTSVPDSGKVVTIREVRGALTRAQRGSESDGLVRIDKERAVALLADLVGAIDPIEEKAVETFKAAWHKADDEGDSGNRVRRGIQALKDAGLLVGRRGHE